MRILVAIDPSEATNVVIEEVLQQPWPAGARFEIFHAAEPVHLWALSEAAQKIGAMSSTLVAETVTRLEAKGLQVTGKLGEGDPKKEILKRAEEMGADLILLGSHTSSGLARFLLGRVSSAVLRHAPCSVEIIRNHSHATARRILLATDGSEDSKHAAHAIAARPWPEGSEVRVLTVVEPRYPATMVMLEPPFVDSPTAEKLRVEAMQEAQIAVETATAILAPVFTTVTPSISVQLEGAKQLILDEAATWGADLIVVGSHGISGMERFLLGSVSEAVATHAACSVQVVRIKRP